MKVVFVTRGWPTKEDPMNGNYEAVQAKALIKRGVNVTVICINRKSLIHVLESKEIRIHEDNGVKVFTVPVVVPGIPKILQTQNSFLDLWLNQRAFLKAYDYYRRQNGDADLIHAHFVIHAYTCKLVLMRYHLPFIITEHWSKMNDHTIDKGILKRCEAYQWADKVICVSRALADSLKEKLGVESVVVQNMVSDTFFERAVNERFYDSSGIVKFISVGSLVEIKRFDLIIRAMRKCKNLFKCQLSIIGSGPEKDNLQHLIEEYGLHERVFLLGRKTPNEVSELMAASDCFILTSRRETFGIVFIEAMAKGKPVIATACGGPEGFVNPNNGMLIPVGDEEATTKAIDEMVDNIDRYDGTAIRQFCHDNFSEEAISKRIIAVYEDVIRKKSVHISKN